MSFDDHSAVLWDVVLGDATWREALRDIAATTGAPVVLLFRGGPRGWEHWSHDFHICDAGLPALLDPDRNPISRGLSRAVIGATIDRRELICDDVFRRSEPLAIFREQGAFHALICRLEGLAGSPTTQASFGIGFPEHRGDACGERAGDFAAWTRPMQRALRAHSVLEGTTAHQRAYADAFSGIGLGAVALDADLVIREANAEAGRIFAAADGIGSRLGRLTIAPAACERRLQRRILGAWQAPDRDAGDPIHVPRRTGLPGYLLDVVPARGIRAAAIVLITDPVAAHSLPDVECLVQRLGLTSCEARVARLAPLALSKAQIAEQLGLSENTVKSHLGSARAKVGARNMVELALVIRQSLLRCSMTPR